MVKTILSVSGMLLLFGAAVAQEPPQRPPRDGDRPHRPDQRMRRADTNGDGKVSFEELQAMRPDATRERFNRMDRNGDGFLSPLDGPPGQGGGGGHAARREMMQTFMKADANRDGKVTYEEITAAKPGFPRETFSMLDRNGDGVVSRDDGPPGGGGPRDGRPQRPGGEGDMRRPGGGGHGGPGRHGGGRQRMQAADTNGDGRVSFDEVQQNMPQMTRERFDIMDRNGDGFLSPEDRPQRPPRPQGPPPGNR